MPLDNFPKLRSNNLAKTLKKQAIEFCKETGLHGYKYIVGDRPSKIERIVWSMIVFCALTCAGVLMHKAWVYNSSRATLTVIESTHRGIWNYPFPAVTVCNLNRISLSRTREFVQQLKLPKNMSEDYVINEMRLLLELTDPGLFGTSLETNFSNLQQIFDDNNYSIPEVINSVSQNCSNLIISCKWKGLVSLCDRFNESISREGLCCSFNYVRSKEEKETMKQKRITACGYQTGLTLLINPDPADYLATISGSYGSKIMLHFPSDYPDRNAENKVIASGYQVFLSISPEETHSTPDVKKLSVKTRQCLFSEEGEFQSDVNTGGTSNLTYAEYSYTNCVAECRATIIKEECHCIPYYYPQDETRVCNLSDVHCLKLNQDRFDTSFPGVRLSNKRATTSKFMGDSHRPCGCQPDCTLYRYPVEGSSGVLDRTHSYNQKDLFQDLDIKNQSLVHIFFSDLVSIQYRRNIAYDWRNLFASFGGLLGLFAGFSLMSGFELIYFFIVRLITDTYMQKTGRLSH